jgi:hypothetical protein
MYYTTIPLVSERPHNRRWDASKLRELRKRMDTSTISIEEIDNVAADFLDGEIVDLASDWLGNTVRPTQIDGLRLSNLYTPGCSEVVRKVFFRSQVGHARTHRPPLGHDWNPQEWHLGRSEDY